MGPPCCLLDGSTPRGSSVISVIFARLPRATTSTVQLIYGLFRRESDVTSMWLPGVDGSPRWLSGLATWKCDSMDSPSTTATTACRAVTESAGDSDLR